MSLTAKRPRGGNSEKSFYAHGLRRNQFDNGGISRFDRFGIGFGGLSGTTIDLFLDLVKFASNVSGVTIQDWRVSVANLSGVVENDNLGGKVLGTDSGLVLRVGGDISTLDILDRDVLDAESDIVSGDSFGQGFV